MTQRILIRRMGALGDVLTTTAIAHRLRIENPSAEIHFETACPHALVGNPYINFIGRSGSYDRVIDLDLGFESNRKVHQLDAAMLIAFGDTGGPKEIFFARAPAPEIDGVDWSKTITFHPATSWQNRTWDPAWWSELARRVVDAGFTVVCTGTARDHGISGHKILDVRGRFNLAQQAGMIAESRAFMCSNSGLMILAGTTDQQVVTVQTVTRAEFSLPWRHGVLGWGYRSIRPAIECYPCDEGLGAVTYIGCARGDFACVGQIKHDIVMEALLEAAAGIPAPGLSDQRRSA